MSVMKPDFTQIRKTTNSESNPDFVGPSDEEKALAEEYTIITNDHWFDPTEKKPLYVWLKVGSQSFRFGEAEDVQHASWLCWMMAKALAKIIQENK